MQRAFTLVVSPLFAAGGVAMIVDGQRSGWLIAGFFGVCLLVALVEPWFPKRDVGSGYRLVITPEEVACEHPKRSREAILIRGGTDDASHLCWEKGRVA